MVRPCPPLRRHCILCSYCFLCSPFYSEECSFRVPRDFSQLSFYLCEPGIHRDNQLGKVSILHDELKANSLREEQWYPLQHIDADSEVQVRANFVLSFNGIH